MEAFRFTPSRLPVMPQPTDNVIAAAIIALAATVQTVGNSLSNRKTRKSLSAQMENGIHDSMTRIEDKVDRLDQKMERVETRVGALERQVDRLDERSKKEE